MEAKKTSHNTLEQVIFKYNVLWENADEWKN